MLRPHWQTLADLHYHLATWLANIIILMITIRKTGPTIISIPNVIFLPLPDLLLTIYNIPATSPTGIKITPKIVLKT